MARARLAESGLRRQSQQLTAALYAEEIAGRRVRSLAEVALALTTAATVDVLPTIIVQGLDVLDSDGGELIVAGSDGGRVVVTAPLTGGATTEGTAELPYDCPLPGPYVGRTGQPLLLLNREAALAFDPDVMRELSDRTGREAWACLPIAAGAEVLGVLSVTWTKARTLSLEELALLDGFAAQFATSLQRSLLTTPAEHAMLDIAVRYLPAAEEAQVGGDWYDVFVTRNGRTLLVVGDVSGHDRTAAAMMGQVRNLLRRLAFDSDDGPAALLSRLDAALLGLDLETLATCVVVTIEGVDGVCRIRWSNAGHLEPLLRLPDGAVAPLNGSDDLLLGLDPDTERHEGALDDGRSEDDIALLVARVGTC